MPKTLEPIDIIRLPPDIRAVFEAEIEGRRKAESLASDLQRAADEREDVIKRFEHLVKELRHALYGKKSEKLAPDDRQLCFEDLEVAEVEEHQASPKDTCSAAWLSQPLPGGSGVFYLSARKSNSAKCCDGQD